MYAEFVKPKKNGGTRLVENPARELKLVQARLARLLMRIAPPDYLFCPVKGRSYVSNAARHRGQRVIRCLDIRKYFPSTPSRRVYWFFHKVMKCRTDIAGTLTSIATYNGHLPTGSPLSPIMAYYAYYDMWNRIADICNRNGCTLSVYIDDVTVSGENVRASTLWEIKKLIHGAGLIYHKEKAFFGGVAEVTGAVIFGDALVVPNRHLRAAAEYKKQITSEKSDLIVSKITRKLAGVEGHIRQIQTFE